MSDEVVNSSPMKHPSPLEKQAYALQGQGQSTELILQSEERKKSNLSIELERIRKIKAENQLK